MTEASQRHQMRIDTLRTLAIFIAAAKKQSALHAPTE